MEKDSFTSRRAAISQRMTRAWIHMTENGFCLVKVYLALDPQKVEKMMRDGNITLPEGQEPIADYLCAVRDYFQPSPNSNS